MGMENWNEASLREDVEASLKNAGIDKTPKDIYEEKIKPALEDYKKELEDNNFQTKLKVPDNPGIVSGEYSATLRIDSFKIPSNVEVTSSGGLEGAGEKAQLSFTISAKEKEVTAKGTFKAGKSKSEQLGEGTLSNFKQKHAERVIEKFNRKFTSLL